MRVDIICAWCGRKYGKKSGFKTPEPTHGICSECYEKEMAKLVKKNPERRTK